MGAEPYGAGKIPNHWDTGKKRPVIGEIVVISGLKLRSRELHLIRPQTRVVNKNEVHELIVTDDVNATPGGVVNNILYLGFFEITTGGVIIVGDDITVGKRAIGKIGGFNDIHSPNHINIIVTLNQEFAREIGIGEGDKVVHKLPLNLMDSIVISRG